MSEWNYPHHFNDGVNEVASGNQVDENFAQAQTKIEAAQVLAAAVTAALAGQLGGLKVKVGEAQATYAGGVARVAVAHGLGKVPVFFGVTPLRFFADGVTEATAYYNQTYVGLHARPTTTTAEPEFDGAPSNGAITPFLWIAVG